MSRRLTTQEFIEKAIQLHNGKYDYSKSVYIDSRSPILIICPEHGEFEQRASSHLLGNGCPECAKIWSETHKQNLRKSSRKSRGMTTDEWVARCRLVHGGKYDYSETVYVNQRTNVKIICPVHGMFEQKADSHLRGYGCKLCGIESDARKMVDHVWSDEQREKVAATCLERYGATRYLDSAEGRLKIAQVKSKPEFREKMHEIISSDAIQEKTRQTCLDRYGVSSVMKLESVVNKVGESKQKNGTWSTSKPEEDMYTYLLNKFGEDDVFRQYKCSRYPYHCDFYIKSLDLFIELNATWLHGKHWFDADNLDDIQTLNEWHDAVLDGKRFYEVAIDVWTVRDVKKREIAIENNLNYVVFWDTKLSDFLDWINNDKLVLNNIL